jgi:hypothetical protein
MRPVKRKRQTLGLHGKLFQFLFGIGFAGSVSIFSAIQLISSVMPKPAMLVQRRFTVSKIMDKLQRGLFITPGSSKSSVSSFVR